MLENLSYLGLFAVSFLSATLYPLASEAFVVAFVLNDFSPFLIFLVASVANTLGSLSTYALAFFGEKFLLEKYFKKSLQKAQKYHFYVKKFGAFFAFFTFLPLIGDIFALALGFAKYPFLKTCLFIALGKSVRYGFLIFITLHFS